MTNRYLYIFYISSLISLKTQIIFFSFLFLKKKKPHRLHRLSTATASLAEGQGSEFLKGGMEAGRGRGRSEGKFAYKKLVSFGAVQANRTLSLLATA